MSSPVKKTYLSLEESFFLELENKVTNMDGSRLRASIEFELAKIN